MAQAKKKRLDRLDENTCRLLKIVVDHFDEEDKPVRERQIVKWRRLKLLWDGIRASYEHNQEVAHDWRIPKKEEDSDQEYYDKPVNVFRAYLESIFAALSVTVPPIKCYPDNAEDDLDLLTASTGDKIAAKIYRENDAPLLWLHGLFIFGTEGLTFYHTYLKEDAKYGTYEEEIRRDIPEEHEITTCPKCGFELDDRTLTPEESALPSEPIVGEELAPPVNPDIELPVEVPGEEETIPLEGYETETGEPDLSEDCPNCGTRITAQVNRETQTISQLVEIKINPKSKVCIDAYGGSNVKFPVYAKKVEQAPYLNLSEEINYVQFIEEFPDMRDEISAGEIFDPWEAWGRLNTQYAGDVPENNVTKRQVWLRPMAFNCLDEDDQMELRKQFPNGACVVLGNDVVADYRKESLDEHWSLSRNPLSDFLHHDPIGMLLISLQEITNDIISLTLQTIEHGITQTFASKAFLNFEAYRQAKVRPGDIFPANAPTGRSLSDGFYDVKTATLSGEVLPFAQWAQQLGQTVSGALPSLFGGEMEGSETASQYAMSRQQALQRVGNIWKIQLVLWKDVQGKSIPLYIKAIKEDERDVRRDDSGNFINIYIRKTELTGKIGRVEIEANENLPITWNQRRDAIMQIMNANNPAMMSMMTSPENIRLLHEAVGLTEFHIPGEADREKQIEEIRLLVNSEPIIEPMGVDMMGQPQEQEIPSVEVDPEIDNHSIEYETCRNWLISPEGRLAKQDNEAGYRNVLLHAKMHKMLDMQAQMAAQAAALPPGEEELPEDAGAADSGGGITKPAPIEGETDVKSAP